MTARLTSADIDKAIERAEYTVLPDGYTTVCTLFLDNGRVVHGLWQGDLPAIEHAEATRLGAFAVARREVWALLSFRRADQARAARPAG